MSRPAITRYQTISFRFPGLSETTTGFVEALSRTTLTIVHATRVGLGHIYNTEGMLPIDLLQKLDAQPHAGTPIPPALLAHIETCKASEEFIRGNLVRFNHHGHTCTGRVLSGGKHPEVVLSLTHTIRVDPTQMTRTTPPAMEAPFDGWAVILFKRPQKAETNGALMAIIRHDRFQMVEATNNGHGNPNDYWPAGKGTRDDVDRFRAMIRNFMADQGLHLPHPEDAWVEWAWMYHPSGISFREYLEQNTKAVTVSRP